MANYNATQLIAIVLLVAVVGESWAHSSRCFTLCRRSEDDIGCRRCRFREPLRFGKRGPGLNAVAEGTAPQSDQELLMANLRARLMDLEPIVTRLAALRRLSTDNNQSYQEAV